MKQHSKVIDDDGAIEVWCADEPDGVFTVTIRTLTYEEFATVLHTPRRAPKRVH